MQFDQPFRRPLSRRRLLQYIGLAGAGLSLGGCSPNGKAFSLFSPLNPHSDGLRTTFEPLNQRIEEIIFKSQTPAPEFSVSAIEPNALLVNTYDATPLIDPTTYKLVIDGAVNNPLKLGLADLKSMPLTSMVIRHICVEGWSAIVQWGGVRLYDLARLAQPKENARYVYFESGDGYYESWDIASSLHPQTLLAYQKNGDTLSVDNGFPIRLASPIKLGYKQSKWVTRITFMNELPARKGYWVDDGYEWFAGL
jgi:DMSO/TMAO reductase YedYZ molybdopterin-dependent catalytic subunit